MCPSSRPIERQLNKNSAEFPALARGGCVDAAASPPPSRGQIIAQVEECALPSVSGWQAGLERHARARPGARAAILDCEASICHRELAAAPTPPPPPSRGQIIAQVEEWAARKSEISFHMKCEVKVKVKSIRCFHVKSRTLALPRRRLLEMRTTDVVSGEKT